jgi:hypothetical protein
VIEIKNRWNDSILFAAEAADMREAVIKACSSGANLSGAYLSGAYLSGAYLSGANLSGAYLYGAYLESANLSGANLSGAYLSGAYLSGANLYGANLYGAYLESANLSGANLESANLSGANLERARIERARIDWSSHALIAELLLRKCGDEINPQMIARRKVAGLILISRDWCWPDFLRLRKSRHFSWAVDVLAAHVTEGDGAPDILVKRAKEIVAIEVVMTKEDS